MRGHAETPEPVVDRMVEALFGDMPPREGDRLLDPGCGEGAFIAGVLRYCKEHRLPTPEVTGIELDPARLEVARERFAGIDLVELLHADYLTGQSQAEHHRFIIGNPPYVGLPSLSPSERACFRSRFRTARGRFDLYFLFFERSLELLASDGRLAFVTPEKYLYVESATALRTLLAERSIERVDLLPDQTFADKIAYPCVTVLSAQTSPGSSVCLRRDGTEHSIDRASLGSEPWWATIQGRYGTRAVTTTSDDGGTPATLYDASTRISAGVATGADAIFVRPRHVIPPSLRAFSHPTVSGRELRPGDGGTLPPLGNAMLLPYHSDGSLMGEDELGALGDYLNRTDVRRILEKRYCTRHKPWYAFHDSVPMRDILQPKILCKDIGTRPYFWIDHDGNVVPRHSIYYIVPRAPDLLEPLREWLNGDAAQAWFEAHCHRAANGFLRLQTRTLARLPIPADLKARHRSMAHVA